MFPWRKSRLARNAESCEMIHEGKHYWLVAATTIKDDEFQALVNGVRITKELFAYMADARAACQRWYEREVLGITVNVEAELRKMGDECDSVDGLIRDILNKFTITPKR